MPAFSERYGYTEKPLQIDSISKELRNRIWNSYSCQVVTNLPIRRTNYLEEIMDACGLVFKNSYSDRDLNDNLTAFRKWFMQAEWYKIYDFIEIYLSYLPAKERRHAIKDYNALLLAENAGFRVVDDHVIPVTNEEEISCIVQAHQTKYDSVNMHFKKATELFSRRPTPDYENSIKESISAVEALCCIITGETGKKGTLGNTITKLKDKGVHIHPSMEKAYSALYGYTNDEGGIRHGSMDFNNAPAEDAKYMLISCSAFVNYLIEKWSKVSSI